VCHRSWLLINKFNAPGSGCELERTFTKFVEIAQYNGHYAVQVHSRSPILVPIESSYTTSLVINTNLPPILHRLPVIVKFSLARGQCLTFTLALGVIPCQYRRKWYVTKILILWPTFSLQKVSVYLQPLLHNPPRNLPTSVKLQYGYAVQGYPNSPSLIPIESSYATSY